MVDNTFVLHYDPECLQRLKVYSPFNPLTVNVPLKMIL